MGAHGTIHRGQHVRRVARPTPSSPTAMSSLGWLPWLGVHASLSGGGGGGSTSGGAAGRERVHPWVKSLRGLHRGLHELEGPGREARNEPEGHGPAVIGRGGILLEGLRRDKHPYPEQEADPRRHGNDAKTTAVRLRVAIANTTRLFRPCALGAAFEGGLADVNARRERAPRALPASQHRSHRDRRESIPDAPRALHLREFDDMLTTVTGMITDMYRHPRPEVRGRTRAVRAQLRVVVEGHCAARRPRSRRPERREDGLRPGHGPGRSCCGRRRRRRRLRLHRHASKPNRCWGSGRYFARPCRCPQPPFVASSLPSPWLTAQSFVAP